MATGKTKKIEQWVQLGSVSGGSNTTITLPTAGTYLACTCHNSTAGTNTLWILRGAATANSGAWLIGTGNGASSNITVTNMGNRQFKFASSSGSSAIYVIQIGG